MADDAGKFRAFGVDDVSEVMIGWKVRYEREDVVLYTTVKAVRIVGDSVGFLLDWPPEHGCLVGAEDMLAVCEYKSLPGACWQRFGVEVNRRFVHGNENLN